MTEPPGPPERRRPRRRLQPINFNALRPNEHPTDIELVVNTTPDSLVTLPNGLASPRWPCCYMPSRVAERYGIPIENTPPEEIRASRGPRNRIVSTRFVRVWWRAVHLNWPFYLMRIPVLEFERYGDLGTSLIIGRDFINYVFGSGGTIPTYVQPTLQTTTGIVDEDMLLFSQTLDEDMEARVGSWLEDTYSFQEN